MLEPPDPSATDLASLVEALRARQAARGRPLSPGPAALPAVSGVVGDPDALFAALATLLEGTAEAAGTPDRPATWVLARRPGGEWRFAGTCGALPEGTAERISADLPEARFGQLECGAWTLDLPAGWLVRDA